MKESKKLEEICAALLEACKQKDAQIQQLTQQLNAPCFDTTLAKILAALKMDGLLLPSKQPELYEVNYRAFQNKILEAVPPDQHESFNRWLAAFEIIKVNPNTGNLYHRAGVGKIAKFSQKLIEYLERGT